MVFLSASNVTKGYLIFPLIWWVWFRQSADRPADRAVIGTILVACIIAVAVSQLAQYLPNRTRPLFDLSLHLRHPEGLHEEHYNQWSSFPSDHATLFFSIAVGFFFISPLLGWYALAHALFIVSFPRVYIGLHYLSDVLAGAVLGGGLAYLLLRQEAVRRWVGYCLDRWEHKYTAIFYAVFFAVTAQMLYLFYDANEFAHYVWAVVKGLWIKLVGASA